MKTIVLIAAICLVLASCWFDLSQAQTTNTSTTDTGTPKKVTVSNLQYSAVRRIRIGTTTTSSTSTKSKSSSKSNRNLRAKRNQAAKKTVSSRRQNSRRLRR